MKKNLATKLLALLFAFALVLPALYACNLWEEADPKVLLISIDGMRPDATQNTEYGRYLKENAAYSLDSKTITPSITLPSHMSMFHSVTPDVHGVTSNTYTPSEALGYGITEALSAQDMSSAIFYNWNEIGYVVTEGSTEASTYIGGEIEGWEQANRLLGAACLEYLDGEQTADFVFLYLGFLDEWGHKYSWLSDEYYYALNESFAIVEAVTEKALALDYTVIITADHGGHDYTHGTELPEDMTIPIFILGEKFTPATNLGERSILDIAPTVLNLLGASAPSYWQGAPITDK